MIAPGACSSLPHTYCTHTKQTLCHNMFIMCTLFLCCHQVIQDELGAPWYEVYADLTPEPIAAASLGQVYKGTLHTGQTVAVKVGLPC